MYLVSRLIYASVLVRMPFTVDAIVFTQTVYISVVMYIRTYIIIPSSAHAFDIMLSAD